jgi:O-antigen ligase
MPLLILFFSFVLYEIKNLSDKKKNIKRFIKYICISLSTLLFILYVNEIKDFIIKKYVVQDTYSRTIVRILESNLLDYSGRDVIYDKSIELIKKSPVIGNGIGADSIMIRKEKLFSVNYDIHNLGGLHAHNGILEFAIEFGLILLGFALVVLGKTCINAYRQVEMNENFIFLVLLLSIGIIRTVLGNPYWYSQAFWMALAWCIVILNKKNSKNNK